MGNGSDWLPPGASAPQEPKAKKNQTQFLGYGMGHWIAAGIIAVVALYWFAGGNDSPPQSATRQLSVAEKLVLIDGNTGREREYDLLLGDLAVKCGEAKIDVSDTAVRGTQVMKEHRNVSMSALEFLQAMDGAIPTNAENINCTEIAAALIALTGQ
jgi:hypothetical protein